jgi:hypothetical protein
MVDPVGIKEAGFEVLERSDIAEFNIIGFPNEFPDCLVHVDDTSMRFNSLGCKEGEDVF